MLGYLKTERYDDAFLAVMRGLGVLTGRWWHRLSNGGLDLYGPVAGVYGQFFFHLQVALVPLDVSTAQV
jgi:hypothetical protein